MKKIGDEIAFVNQKFIVTRFLGEGKSGYSYLIENSFNRYVLKVIHNKKNDYYRFEDKFSAEIHAYETLSELNINIPKLVFYDEAKQFLIKEYIEGSTIGELVASNKVEYDDFKEILKWSIFLKTKSINLDYFPFNFVKSDGRLFYIDYECNQYSDEWNFENWGIYYWINNEGIKSFIENDRDHSFINKSNTGKPITKGLELKANFILKILNSTDECSGLNLRREKNE